MNDPDTSATTKKRDRITMRSRFFVVASVMDQALMALWSVSGRLSSSVTIS